MEKTFAVGDYILVDEVVHARSESVDRRLLPHEPIQRREVVLFHSPAHFDQILIKRVIGLPGDHLKMTGGMLFLNGKKENEPYAVYSYGGRGLPLVPDTPVNSGARAMLRYRAGDGELIVPAGAIFVMGDNRDESLDSRFWGFVPIDSIVGRPVLIYWSFEPFGASLASSSRFAYTFYMLLHWPGRVRWHRVLRRIPSG
jgi:signal peptidase I